MSDLFIGLNKSTSYKSLRLQKEWRYRRVDFKFILWKELIFKFNQGIEIKTAEGDDLKKFNNIICMAPAPSRRFSLRRRLFEHFYIIADYLKDSPTYLLNATACRRMPYYDKFLQYYLLARAGVKIVPSVLYTGEKIIDPIYKDYFDFPYIAKSIDGSKGIHVYKIRSLKKITRIIKKYGWGRVMIQQYLPIKEDYRIIVLGETILGGIKRKKPCGQAFKTNVSAGAEAEQAAVTKDMKRIALRAAQVVGAEFAGVDVVEFNGSHYVLEVNLFPGFSGFEAATNIDVPQHVFDYLSSKKKNPKPALAKNV